MELFFKIAVFLHLFIAIFAENRGDFLVVYDTGTGEIRVNNASSLLKTFKIQIKEVTGGLAVDFENDIIYFADRMQIYQIYLIDGSGKRRKSGKGELFTNPNCEHFETVLYSPGISERSMESLSHKVNGLYFKKDTKALYTLRSNNGTGGYYDRRKSLINQVSSNGTLTNGSNSFYMREESPYLFPTDLIINKDGIYATGAAYQDGRPYKFYRWIYRMHRGHESFYDWRNNRFYDSYLTGAQDLLRISNLNVSAFTIDEKTARLFFAQGSSIRVIDHDLSKNVTLRVFMKVVIANSRVTKGIRALAVHGKTVIWSSSALDGIFVGKLNDRGTFISSKTVTRLNGTVVDKVRPRHILIVRKSSAIGRGKKMPRVLPTIQ